jgi:pyrroline-5-carboxylate reductase
MSGYKNFAVVGAGTIGSFIIRQLLTDKAAGTVDNVVVLTRQASLASESACRTPFTNQSSQGSKTTVDPAAKLIPVDYSNKELIKTALTGVDVVISTVPPPALDVQPELRKLQRRLESSCSSPPNSEDGRKAQQRAASAQRPIFINS